MCYNLSWIHKISKTNLTTLSYITALTTFLYLLALQCCCLYLFITFCAPRFSSSMVFISLDFSINQACFMAHWAVLGPITFIWVEGKWDNPQHQQRIRCNQRKRGTFIRHMVQWYYYKSCETGTMKQWHCVHECKFVESSFSSIMMFCDTHTLHAIGLLHNTSDWLSTVSWSQCGLFFPFHLFPLKQQGFHTCVQQGVKSHLETNRVKDTTKWEME